MNNELTKFLGSEDPRQVLEQWFNDAVTSEDNAHAVTFSTVGLDGAPNARTLLVKEVSKKQILLFTNYNSLKGREIEKNNDVALTFFWQRLGKQVRIRGKAHKCDFETSKDYFNSRPLESRVASFISKQSEEVESREVLVNEYLTQLEIYKSKKLPYPTNWGGYIIEPSEITFFIYGEFRLNDRFKFIKDGDSWKSQRLYP